MKRNKRAVEYLNCLIVAQTLETQSAYYFQSDGRLYEKDYVVLAKQLVECLQTLLRHENFNLRDKGNKDLVTIIKKTVDHLNSWSVGTLPDFSPNTSVARMKLYALLSKLKPVLIKECGATVSLPEFRLDPHEGIH